MGSYVNINFVRGEPDRARLIRPLSIIPPIPPIRGKKPSSGGVASSGARAANESGNSSMENGISNVNDNERELMMRQMMMAQIQMSMGMGGTNPQLPMGMGGASPNIAHAPQMGMAGMNPAMAFQTNGQMQGPTDPMAMMAMHEMMMQRHATAMSQYASMNGANNLGMDGPQNSPARDIRGEDEQNLIRPQVPDSGGILETDRLRSWDGAARERVQQHYQGQMRSQQQQEQGGVFQRLLGGVMPTVESGGMSTMDMNLHHQQQMNQQMQLEPYAFRTKDEQLFELQPASL
ncbi:hypothetical protein THAOC_36526 [Thalassiosira oceanica]|uniref:Uncharacterized protein n=1 Tax=Thalassiosira oceanica TaxID=159749 RepID=K0RED4_THAOC|nr:hypothetical protein THAOC_36526 [Thalassiosira oceanica]|eukprot:EJK44902.1 hypothetical protein THAOC_36526 [Thalassiosira oceanica]